MICSTLALLWKSQYFQRPIYKPVEDLWWSLYCKNIKPPSIFTKSSNVDARMCSKYTSAFWRPLQTFYFFKGFLIIRFLKSVQSYYFLKYFLIIKHAKHLIKKKILFPCSKARDVPVRFYITHIKMLFSAN